MAETANPARPAGLSGQVAALRATFGRLTLYEQFEHAVIIVLTVLIIAVVAAATWHLALMVMLLLFTDEIRPDNQAVFQTVFGMIFTVIIALEFKHSLLMVLARQERCAWTVYRIDRDAGDGTQIHYSRYRRGAGRGGFRTFRGDSLARHRLLAGPRTGPSYRDGGTQCSVTFGILNFPYN